MVKGNHGEGQRRHNKSRQKIFISCKRKTNNKQKKMLHQGIILREGHVTRTIYNLVSNYRNSPIDIAITVPQLDQGQTIRGCYRVHCELR